MSALRQPRMYPARRHRLLRLGSGVMRHRLGLLRLVLRSESWARSCGANHGLVGNASGGVLGHRVRLRLLRVSVFPVRSPGWVGDSLGHGGCSVWASDGGGREDVGHDGDAATCGLE